MFIVSANSFFIKHFVLLKDFILQKYFYNQI